MGLGEVIAMAEYLVLNENNKGKDNAKAAVKKFIRSIERKWLG